jgi:hypothetical protein
MSNSISQRVAALETRSGKERITYIVTAPSGNVLMIDQNPGEDLVTFRRRVREAWLAGGNEPELLPAECQDLAETPQ